MLFIILVSECQEKQMIFKYVFIINFVETNITQKIIIIVKIKVLICAKYLFT